MWLNLTEYVSETDQDKNTCIWKPPIKQKIDGQLRMLKFPCRYPEKEKNAETCNPCLLGDLFAMQYTQLSGMKKQSAMNEEVMTFLRNMTSDGSLDDLK